MTNTEFSRILRKLMVEHDVSAYTLAQASGVSKCAILAWLNGKHSPRVETAGILLDYFGLKLEVVAK